MTGLPRTVVALGLVSLFNDFASEMVVPLVPIFLASALGAGPAALGLIEGLAEAVANLLKLWSGLRSDAGGRRRKPYVLFGYALSNAARPLIGLCGAWTAVLVLRVTDRVGKGVRAAPRDALIADAVDSSQAGRAYGYTRALDHAGAVLGALAAAAVLHWGGGEPGTVIALSAVPGLAAVALAAWGVREAPARPQAPSGGAAAAFNLRWTAIEPPARRFLLVVACFSLGKLPEAFLMLRGHELGMSAVGLLLMWAAMHAVKAGVSEAAGRLADRAGRRPLILAGWAAFAASLLGLSASSGPAGLWGWSLGLGLAVGLSEGPERALVRDLSTTAGRGAAFGWYHMTVGLAAIPAGLLLGGLWSWQGAGAAFAASSASAALAAAGFWRLVRPAAGAGKTPGVL